MKKLICVLLASAALSAQEKPRDLVLETPADMRKLPPGMVPRGYALVVGVAQYKNLDASKQLQYPESDAELIYRLQRQRIRFEEMGAPLVDRTSGNSTVGSVTWLRVLRDRQDPPPKGCSDIQPA